MEVVLATGNVGKVREMQGLLSEFGFQVRPQSDFNVPEADETGLTFIENAILKARNAAAHTGLPAIADDSGIAVDALNGAPGIYSARYAGVGATDAENVDKLLAAIADVPDAQRTASFHCVLAFLQHADDPTPLICSASWSGVITHAPVGSGGFGYDPVFFVPEQGCTSAELSPALKREISHRGQALRQLVALKPQFIERHLSFDASARSALRTNGIS